jgi:hypothetical protein
MRHETPDGKMGRKQGSKNPPAGERFFPKLPAGKLGKYWEVDFVEKGLLSQPQIKKALAWCKCLSKLVGATSTSLNRRGSALGLFCRSS